VHSFADGLPGQLLIFLFFFFWLTGFLLMQNPLLKILFTVVSLLFLVIQFYVTDLKEISIGLVTAYIGLFVFSYFKYFPKEGSEEDEHHTSREFWMFIAAIVLLISCIHIIFTTSMPVFNKVFGTKKTPNTNIFDDYVRYQILFASIICIMMSFGLYLKYKATPVKKLIADLSISILITSALCLIVGIGYQLDFENDTFRLVSYWLFFFAASFAIIANVNYFVRILKGKIMLAGAPIAHLGFGMIMLGAFISTSQSNVLTENVGQIDLEHESDGKIKNNENLFLPINDTLPVGDYKVTYNNIHKEGHNIYFDVDYFNKKGEKEFTLSPFMQLNDKMGNVSEPATKHFLHKDIYTHMQTFELAQPKEVKLKNGDSLKVGKGHLVLDTVMVKADQTGMLYCFEFNYQVNGKFVEKVILENEKNHIESKMATLKKTDAKVRLLRIAPEEDSLVFEVADANSGFMILKAIEFPFINILWAGCIVMVIGTVIAIIHRNKQNKSLVNVG
jgi:cytochrome c-type biogenesis protein CcmF